MSSVVECSSCVVCGCHSSVGDVLMCVDVHVQCLVERVLHVCLCGCSCPVFG